jgi:hypothetical protein
MARSWHEVFTRGFRCGANARAADGHPLAGDRVAPPAPPPPFDLPSAHELDAWRLGHELGYGMGASDAELASVAEPGAHGMIREIGPEMLQLMGLGPAAE